MCTMKYKNEDNTSENTWLQWSGSQAEYGLWIYTYVSVLYPNGAIQGLT